MNQKQRKAAVEKLNELRSKLLDAVEAYNDLSNDMDDMVEQFVREHMQEARAEVVRYANELASEVEDTGLLLRDYIDKKSEQWHESDTGQEWESVCDAFETVFGLEELADDTITVNVTVDDLDASDVDDLINAIEALEGL